MPRPARPSSGHRAPTADQGTVLVGGAVVVRDGRLLSLDLDEILHTAREQRARLLARTALR